jgi:hypothetical protein
VKIKHLQLIAAQQKISEMEAEDLQLRKERDSAEHRAEGLMKGSTTSADEIREVTKKTDEYQCRFVPDCFSILFYILFFFYVI